MYFPPDIDKKFILDRISEEEIFQEYGVPVVNYMFKSPLRIDNNPTCTFYRARNSNKLYLKDWSGDFHGDCFDLVMRVTGISNFYEALGDVAKRFGLIKNTGELKRIDRKPKVVGTKIEKKLCSIRIKRMEWTQEHRAFWNRWDFHPDTLKKFNVYPIERMWLNGESYFWYGVKQEIAFAYHFGGYDYKIYFPERSEGRFLHNDANILQGYSQLPSSGDHLVVTKSYKDVMKMDEFGIVAVAPMSESQIISEEMYHHFKERFENIFMFYDNDRAGMRTMIKARKIYPDMGMLMLPREFPKDFTDFYEEYGLQDTEILIQQTKEELLWQEK